MITVRDVVQKLNALAPFAAAESWDNVGLLWGDPATNVSRVMTCLTVTTAIAQEAIAERAELIVSHHPVLFRQTRKVTADMPGTGFLWTLARAGISVASPHTAFDNAQGGINDLLANRLGLRDVEPLRPAAPVPSSRFKIVVFTPESDRERVLHAAFAAGAGIIGHYGECSFAIPGQGTFFGDDTTHPTVGAKGHRETVDELRLEFICPASQLASALAAVRASHSYEEPAIDVYPLAGEPVPRFPGAGRVGRLDQPATLGHFARLVAHTFESGCVQFAGDPTKPIGRAAICCGAGDDFLREAHQAGAHVLVTGEARFHRGIEAEELSIGLITAGHHATERIGVVQLANALSKSLPGLAIWPSQHERDPFQLVTG